MEPPGYAELLTTIKAEVRAAQVRAHRVVNTELLSHGAVSDQAWQVSGRPPL